MRNNIYKQGDWDIKMSNLKTYEEVKKIFRRYSFDIDFKKYKFVHQYYSEYYYLNVVAQKNGMNINEVKAKIQEELVEIEKVISSLDNEDQITLDSSIRRLDLITRAENILFRYKIYLIKDLEKYSLGDLSGLKNMGKESVKDIVFKLKEKGFNPKEILLQGNEENLMYHWGRVHTIEELLGY